MNNQPVKEHGYYLHYKHMVYKLIAFVTTDDNERQKQLLYQPQYATPEFGELLLWAKPIDSFFLNIKNPKNKNELIPRFEYLGMNEEEVKQELKKKKIDITPEFRKTSMLDKNIENLVHGDYKILAFAKDSDAENLTTAENLIIYLKKGERDMLILPEKEFFKKSGINSKDPTIAKYLKHQI